MTTIQAGNQETKESSAHPAHPEELITPKELQTRINRHLYHARAETIPWFFSYAEAGLRRRHPIAAGAGLRVAWELLSQLPDLGHESPLLSDRYFTILNKFHDYCLGKDRDPREYIPSSELPQGERQFPYPAPPGLDAASEPCQHWWHRCYQISARRQLAEKYAETLSATPLPGQAALDPQERLLLHAYLRAELDQRQLFLETLDKPPRGCPGGKAYLTATMAAARLAPPDIADFDLYGNYVNELVNELVTELVTDPENPLGPRIKKPAAA